MKQRFALDSWAMLAYIQAEEPAASRVRELLLAAAGASVELFASAINIGEVYYTLWRRHGRAVADVALAHARELPLSIVPATWDQVLTAARFKATNRMSYADGFVAAVGEELRATVLTGDPELVAALSGRLDIEPLRRQATPDSDQRAPGGAT
ncbi:MAG: PIN domain-containing protein [Anaerolineae bacterium]